MALGAAAMGITSIGMLWSAVPDGARFASVLAFSLLGGLVPASVFSGAPVHAKSPQHTGSANGMVMQASQFIIPIVVAWVATRMGGWGATLGVMLALSVIGVTAGVAITRYERRLPV